MSALPQQYIQVDSGKLSKKPIKSGHNSQQSPSRFPKPQPFPVYIKILLLLQKGSLGIAGFSIVTGIMLYLSTVSIPQQWSKEYRDLETLQRQERQLTTIGESLKYTISQQARQFQMSPITSKNTVFLKPNAVAANPQTNQDPQGKSLKKITLGY
ncbi:MAG: hypothetical protein AB4372_35780 [Xenococcus sp. (in: cyanobacteria)]